MLQLQHHANNGGDASERRQRLGQHHSPGWMCLDGDQQRRLDHDHSGQQRYGQRNGQLLGGGQHKFERADRYGHHCRPNLYRN